MPGAANPRSAGWTRLTAYLSANRVSIFDLSADWLPSPVQQRQPMGWRAHPATIALA